MPSRVNRFEGRWSSAGARAVRPSPLRWATPGGAREESLLRRAAEAEDATLTEFILRSAVGEAERVLADRQWFVASDMQFEQFLAALDQPVRTERLATLFARDSVFEKPFTIDD